MIKIGRNAPCPCGSGRKYKKCCMGKSGKYELEQYTAECNKCGKIFDKRITGTFESIKREGKRIYFCPKCNENLSCSYCENKLGEKSFDLISCPDCGEITIICEDCVKDDRLFSEHAEGHKNE